MMMYFANPRFLGRVAFGLMLLAGSGGDARADAIDFSALGSQQVPSLDVGGVTISGSNTLSVGPSGLGILGGVPVFPYNDYMIDPTESITFRFDSSPVTDIVLSAKGVGTFASTPMATAGKSLFEAFGRAGQSLGTVNLIPSTSPPLSFNISAAFSNQPISTFRLQPEGDSVTGNFLNLGGLSYDASIPEPSSLLAWGLSVLIVLGHALRRHRSGRCEPPS